MTSTSHHAANVDVVERFLASFDHRWPTDAELDEWPADTRLAAWCVAHYRLLDGRIAAIEQHDCYEPARPPGG